jgi:hypothetical protein
VTPEALDASGEEEEALPSEAVQAKPQVQRAVTPEALEAPEEEEEAFPSGAVQAKPQVQRAATPEALDAPEEEAFPSEAIARKPQVRRAAAVSAPRAEEEVLPSEAIALKPVRVPLSKPTVEGSVRRLPYSERRQAPLPLVTPQVGHESSGATAQRKAGDSARADMRSSPLPLVQRGAFQGAGKVQREEIPATTAVESSNANVDAAPGTTQIDLDDLARIVYSLVRRLFAVERERKSSIR